MLIMKFLEGDGAFYGPKIDFVLTDALKENGNAEPFRQISTYLKGLTHHTLEKMVQNIGQ